MAKKKKVRRREKKVRSKKSKARATLYKVEDGKIVRTHKECPKCGSGVFMAEHADRYSCGNCGRLNYKR